MKRYRLFLIVIFLAIGSSFQLIIAQEKTDVQKEKDVKMQLSIEQQKKAMADQKKVKAEQEQNNEHQTEIEYSTKSDDELEAPEPPDVMMKIPRNNRSFHFETPYVMRDWDEFNNNFMGEDERTTWDFSKTVKDNTFSSDYAFDVEKTAKSVVMSVMGDCKSGEIRIKIIMPNGKNYSDIVIDESGNLNWRKSFNISEKENQDKAGDWKFQISSAKATGFFKISLQTY